MSEDPVSRIRQLEALLAAGTNSATLRFALASAHSASGNVARALEHGRAAVDLDSDYSAAWRLLGKLYAAAGQPASAMESYRRYLNETPDGFYIVGHTDDTGSLMSNLELSNARAAAVKEALVSEHGIAADSLETRGVGPLAPVSNNTDQAGRALNRRVEIVQRLER